MSYFYAWTPVVIVVATVILLTNAFLALIALMVISLVVVRAGEAGLRRLHDRRRPSRRLGDTRA